MSTHVRSHPRSYNTDRPTYLTAPLLPTYGRHLRPKYFGGGSKAEGENFHEIKIAKQRQMMKKVNKAFI